MSNETPKPSLEAISKFEDCPICKGEKSVMMESRIERQPTDPPSEDLLESYIDYYLCTRCGYTTTSDMVIGSDTVEVVKTKVPRLVIDLEIADNVRNIVWWPAVINIHPKAILYPDGGREDWFWVVAPYVNLTDDERTSYLLQNSEDIQYRLGVEKSHTFERMDFQNALAFFTALVEKNI